MAYYTGQCSSYQHLADILVEKCQAHGWAWQDGILSKDNLFVKIDVVLIGTAQGVVISGGTEKQSSILIGNSKSKVRLGSPSSNQLQIAFPVIYHLFIFVDEVYLIAKSDADKFYYLAFGKSQLIQNTVGNGLWLSATSCYYSNYTAIAIGENNGGSGGSGNASPVAPFWNRNNWAENWSNSIICHGIDGNLWSSGQSRAWCSFEPLIARLPTTYFSDSPLLPYNIYLERNENKMSLIAQLQNARFVRIDNYEPEQILTLGHEKWMIFPFFRKSVQNRNNGYENHTGTFGWAIRYER